MKNFAIIFSMIFSGGAFGAENPKAVMQKAQEKLAQSGIEKKAKRKGQKAPDFSLPNAKGQKGSLAQMLKKGPVVLSFYRGGWCPYCNEQLKSYGEHLDKIKAAGGQLVAISPDKPQSVQDTVSANEIEFEVLSDKQNQVAKKYGLVFQVGKDLKEVYLGFGIDLEKSQGDNSWTLPLPATYVITKDSKIAYSFVDVDYKKRAPIQEILKALKSL